MADESDQAGQEPNLELPKLFGRRKKKKDKAQAAPVEEAAPVEQLPPAEQDEPTRRLPPVPPPPSATAPPVEPPAPEPVPEPEPVPAPVPVPEPEPVPAPVPVPEPDPVPAPEPVQIDPAAEQTTLLPGGLGATALEEPATVTAPVPPKPPRERKPLKLPRINPYAAAVVTGLVVGLLAVVLEIGTQHGCEDVRGVGGCGGIGLVALLVIVALTAFVGAVLLRAFGVSDPTSTSILGIGIVSVLTLVFFLSALESVWMFVVLPALSAGSFALSYWVTASLVEVPRDEDKSTTVT